MTGLLISISVLGFFTLQSEGATITSMTRQTVNGFGASGAWWPMDLYNYPMDVRANVSDLLFNKSTGIGLSDYRYNLGGGGVWVGTSDRAPETPYVSDGVYNFSADPQGTFYLREAARYQVSIITLFVNSAPTTFTNNSRNCGGTLITERIPEYTTYLVDVISYWRTQGVKISNVSPMNEPDNNFSDGDPDDLCSQEGMQVLPEQRAQVVSTLAAALKNAGLETKVIADESSSTGTFESDAPTWLIPEVGASLGAVAHHQYGFANDAGQVQFGDIARNLSGGTPTWFTEICCYVPTDSSETGDPLSTITYGQTYDPTMESGLRMANLISQSLEDIEDEHWDFWTALSNGYGSCTPSTDPDCVTEPNSDGWNDGLIYYDPDFSTTLDYSLSLSKRYTVLRHFAQGVPVGSVRRNVTAVETNWRVLAFDPAPLSDASCVPYSECQKTLFSVVAFNAQSNASSLTLKSDGTFHLSQPIRMFTSSPTEDYVEVTVPKLTHLGTLVVEASPLSIFTLFF